MGEKAWQIVSGVLLAFLIGCGAWVTFTFDRAVDDRVDLKITEYKRDHPMPTGTIATIQTDIATMKGTIASEAAFNREFREVMRNYVNRAPTP